MLFQELFSRFYISFPCGAPLCFTLAKYKKSNLEIFFFNLLLFSIYM